MDKKLPIILDTDKIGNLAVTYIQTIFEEKGWLFRRADGSTDFGIDCEVEITDKNKVTGKLFKCQIKGSKSIDFENDYTTVQVNTSTWNNWKTINLPVIALLCNVSTKKIFWSLPLGFEPKINSESISLKFHKEHCINFQFEEFKAIIHTWLDSFPKQNILREIPFYNKLFKEDLDPLIDWGDAWSEVGDDYNMKVRVFYSHVLELRASLGLRNDKLIPFDYWLIRNQGMCDDPLTFYHGTISELLYYIKHFYNEALAKLRLRLEKVEPSFENNEIVNYFRLDPLMQNSSLHSIVFAHPWGDKKEFHDFIEISLNSLGYSKFKWHKR